jgi:hypothetical protein
MSTPTVRSRVVAELIRRLSTLSIVGGSATWPVADGMSPAETLRTGRYFLEMLVGTDESNDPADSVEEFTFSFDIIAHLPGDSRPAPGVGGPMTPDDQANEIAAAMYGTYADTDAQPENHTLGGLCVNTICRSFHGGVSIDPQFGNNCTTHEIEVRYRFVRGSPEVLP